MTTECPYCGYDDAYYDVDATTVRSAISIFQEFLLSDVVSKNTCCSRK